MVKNNQRLKRQRYSNAQKLKCAIDKEKNPWKSIEMLVNTHKMPAGTISKLLNTYKNHKNAFNNEEQLTQRADSDANNKIYPLLYEWFVRKRSKNHTISNDVF